MEATDNITNYLFEVKQNLKNIKAALYQYYELHYIEYEELNDVVEESSRFILDFGRFFNNLSIETTRHSQKNILASIVVIFSNILEESSPQWKNDEFIRGAFYSIDDIMDKVANDLRRISIIPYRVSIDEVI